MNKTHFFFLSDLKRIVSENIYKILIFSFFISFFISFGFLIKDPKFESEAIFYNEKNNAPQIFSNIKDIFIPHVQGSSIDALSLLKSKSIFEKFIKKAGLQICLVDENKEFYKKFQNILDNLKIFKNLDLDEKEIFYFEDVSYSMIKKEVFYLIQINNFLYKIFDQDKKQFLYFKLDEKVEFKNICFFLKNVSNIEIGKIYKFNVLPMQAAIGMYLTKIDIKTKKTSPNFLNISYFCNSPKLSQYVLKFFLAVLEEYFFDELYNEKKMHLNFLKSRKTEILNEIEDIYSKQKDFYLNNINKNGNFSSEEEMKNLIFQKNNILSQIEKIDFELKVPDNLKDLDVEMLKLENEKSWLNKKEEINNKNFLNLDFLDKDVLKNEYFSILKNIENLNVQLKKLKNFNIVNIETDTFLPSSLKEEIVSLKSKLEDEENYSKIEKDNFNIEIKKFEEKAKKYLLKLLEDKVEEILFLKTKLLNFEETILKKIDQKIDLLKNQKEKFLENKNFELLEKRKFLIKKLDEIIYKTKESAKESFYEKRLLEEIKLLQAILSSIDKSLESKRLDLNTKSKYSRIIDNPSFPLSAKKINFLYYFSLLFVFNLFVFTIFFIYITLLKGVKASLKSLKELNFKVCGKISFNCNGSDIEEIKNCDLETLRNIISSIDESDKIITSVAANGPNFLHYLSALLAIIGKKILLIETFSTILEKQGLYSYLSRDILKPPIEKFQAYDYLKAGEKKYFSFELLKSNDFLGFLDKEKKKYDHILIYSNSNILNAESKLFINISDKIILTIKDEILEDFNDILSLNKKICVVEY